MRSSTSLLASTMVGTSRMTGTDACSPPTSMTISVNNLYQSPPTGEGVEGTEQGAREHRDTRWQRIGEVFEERI